MANFIVTRRTVVVHRIAVEAADAATAEATAQTGASVAVGLKAINVSRHPATTNIIPSEHWEVALAPVAATPTAAATNAAAAA